MRSNGPAASAKCVYTDTFRLIQTYVSSGSLPGDDVQVSGCTEYLYH